MFYFVFLNKHCEPNSFSLPINGELFLMITWLKETKNCLYRNTSHSAFSKTKSLQLHVLFPQKHVHYCYHTTHLTHVLLSVTKVYWGPISFQTLKARNIRIRLFSMLCGSLDGRGVWGRMDTHIYMAESLHCPIWNYHNIVNQLPRCASGSEPACQCRRHRSHGFNPWVGKIPWRRAWQPTPVFLPGESQDRGAWWALVHRIAKSWTGLKWLSVHILQYKIKGKKKKMDCDAFLPLQRFTVLLDNVYSI